MTLGHGSATASRKQEGHGRLESEWRATGLPGRGVVYRKPPRNATGRAGAGWRAIVRRGPPAQHPSPGARSASAPSRFRRRGRWPAGTTTTTWSHGQRPRLVPVPGSGGAAPSNGGPPGRNVMHHRDKGRGEQVRGKATCSRHARSGSRPCMRYGSLTDTPRGHLSEDRARDEPSDRHALEPAVLRAGSSDSESVFGAPDADPEAHM